MMTDGRPKEDTPRQDDRAPGSTPQMSAEAKRLEARRRYLIGGASALPLMVTIGRSRQAFAASENVCQSLLGNPNFDVEDIDPEDRTPSMFCEVEPDD